MSEESLSTTQMKDILKAEHGVTFFPKRQLEIPEVNDNKLISLTGEKKLDFAFYIKFLKKYLEGEPLGDQWGSNHEARRVWRNQMTRKYGEPFLDVCYRNNQFRVNKLGFLRVSVYELTDLVEGSQHGNEARRLREIADALHIKLNGEDPATKEKVGPNYDELESLEDKLEVVYFFEDKILEVLRIFS